MLAARSVLLAFIVMAAGASPAAAQSAPPPPCPASGGAPARLSGLGSRAPVGSERVFTVDAGDAYTGVGKFQVAMTDERGRAFFRGEVTPDREELFLRLDWGDRYAVVWAAGTVEDFGGDRCSFLISKRVSAVHRVYFPAACYDLRYRPRSIVVACGDGNFQLRHARWRGWNRRVVRGRGIALVNPCIPYCAASGLVPIPARLRASGRRRCRSADRYVYTRLSWRLAYRRRGIPRTRGSTTFPCRLYALSASKR